METPRIFPDGRMRPRDAAIYLGLSEGTLANKRITGDGPRFIKPGGRIFYFKRDLDAWLTQGGFFSSTAQA